jgi:hypothetical protein
MRPLSRKNKKQKGGRCVGDSLRFQALYCRTTGASQDGWLVGVPKFVPTLNQRALQMVAS